MQVMNFTKLESMLSEDFIMASSIDIHSTLSNTEEKDPFSFKLIDGFVYLPSTMDSKFFSDRSFPSIAMHDPKFEVVEDHVPFYKDESEWVEIKTETTQEIDYLLKADRIPHDTKYWKQIIIAGLPKEKRGEIWAHFVQAKDEQLLQKYEELVNSSEDPQVDKRIKEDLGRTFAGLPEFNELQELRLFNVLKAYSRIDPEVGYCQGMNYIAALLVMHMMDEPTAFCVLVKIMQRLGWRDLYTHGMPGLMRLLEKLFKKVEEKIPDLFSHLIENDVHFNGLFSHIFLTAFAYRAPLPFVTKVFDLFLLEAEVALIDCTVNILKLMKERVKEHKDEEIHKYIKEKMIEECYSKYDFADIVY